jgi:phosphohistidine phosphatase
MKKIIFVRHGRAEDQPAGITDFERSLTTKGKNISGEMARRFKDVEPNPGQFITSPAFRAIETAYIFAAQFGIKYENILIDSDIYSNLSIKSLLEKLKDIDDKVKSVTLFGHNPSFTEIPDRLSKKGCEFLTKTSIVCISFKTEKWKDIKPDTGKIEYFLKPAKLS